MIRVDSHTGEATDLIDEKTETFIWTVPTRKPRSGTRQLARRLGRDHLRLRTRRLAAPVLWSTPSNGGIKNQITTGEYVVRGIDRIDEEKRQIWFHASGKNAGPGSVLHALLSREFRRHGPGRAHRRQRQSLGAVFTRPQVPDRHLQPRRYAARSTNCAAPTDGKLVCTLEEADITELMERNGWQPLEVFVAKGRDGKTDIWGVICRPRNFDPKKKYPVIESIYAGPQGSFVPKSFGGGNRYASLADLGLHRRADRRHGHGQPLEGVSRRLLAQSQGRRLPRSHSVDEGGRGKVSLHGY